MVEVSYKDIDDIYYHESGHAILATIFSDVLIAKSLSANRNISALDNPHAIGGLKGNYKLNLINTDHDKLILIFLAGICTDDVNHTNGSITESMYEFEQWTMRVDRPQYTGDIKLVLKHFEVIRNVINVTLEEYMVNSMRFLHGILNNNVVWYNVSCVAKALYKSPDKTLTIGQIKEIVAKEGLYKWIGKNVNSIVKQRRQLFVQ